MNKTRFHLGTGIVNQYPFQRIPVYVKQPVKPIKQKEIFTNKILVIFGIVVIIKIIVLLLWI